MAAKSLPPVDPRKGIPTMYEGILYRSRLEARWADMFKRLEMPVDYESKDLLWYIPDFCAKYQTGEGLFEVKGESNFDALRNHVRKVIDSDWPKDFVILGSTMFPHGAVGLYVERDGPGYVVGRALALHCVSCDQTSFVPESGSWRCLRCGVGSYEKHHIGWWSETELEAMWRDAGNRVQWKAPIQ